MKKTNIKKTLKKALAGAFLGVFFLVTPNVNVNAASYNYDFWKNSVPSSEGLAYKATYYGVSIPNANGLDEKLDFNNLADMEVLDKRVYILDSRTTSQDSVYLQPSGSKTVKIVKKSAIYVLNEEMQWIESHSEFELSDYAKEKIDKFLVNWSGTPDSVTEKQLNDASVVSRAPYTTIWVKSETGKEELVLEDGTTEVGDWKTGLFLNDAAGISVVNQNGEIKIYVADTGNARVLKLGYIENTSRLMVEDVYLTPNERDVFFQFDGTDDIKTTTKKVYMPQKVTVDKTKRVYVISRDCYEGIIEYNTAGEYNRFLGKNLVVANPLQAFWGKIFSETQLNLIQADLPPQFSNIQMASNGFIYATAYSDTEATQDFQKIKAINTSGKDILRRSGYVKPDGDVKYLNENSTNKDKIVGPSIFTAITVNDNGIYSAVDKIRGRIFTYDSEGNLLYISGHKGSLSDSINNPTAIAYFDKYDPDGNKEEYVLVLDQYSKSIISFQTTDFGKLVNDATEMYINNEVIESEDVWTEVIKMNSNYELGYVGIGKSILRLGINAELKWTLVDLPADVVNVTNENTEVVNDLIYHNGKEIKVAELTENGKLKESERREVEIKVQEGKLYWRYKVATEKERKTYYKEAMSYFKLGRNAQYYSKAYQFYRDTVLKDNFSLIMAGVIIIVLASATLTTLKIIYSKKTSIKKVKKEEANE